MKSVYILILFLLANSLPAFAARPLSTDDATTVDKSHFELECGFEYQDKTDDEYNWTTTLKYGLSENLDIGPEIPY